ncbi:hypothetical protein N9Y91_06895 [Alphaproteobacteria bacterium]|jgi:hypothetical protein|nr:hypothetical protein [Alphaproteobacteria bacterium]
MNEITITSAQYITDSDGVNNTVKATINGVEMWVGVDPANRHYAEIMRQVEAGTLTIQEAE